MYRWAPAQRVALILPAALDIGAILVPVAATGTRQWEFRAGILHRPKSSRAGRADVA
ncbi:hypothetical protein [Nocardia coubleae]|uniref:Uncharacterized protein n=1 Tax=Nocardia coubleae TaxID=356147 RepID=A0A846WC35_9NOCA|nr:hypothetical protein [Nocardia coubleae]NKX90343.1 hypothetical protein [Nocardia coubleae]